MDIEEQYQLAVEAGEKAYQDTEGNLDYAIVAALKYYENAICECDEISDGESCIIHPSSWEPATHNAGAADECPKHGRFVGTNCTYCDYPPLGTHNAGAVGFNAILNAIKRAPAERIVTYKEAKADFDGDGSDMVVTREVIEFRVTDESRAKAVIAALNASGSYNNKEEL